MKDSFIFEGKKYISARRASEISDYSSDYIGQLCRAEKLDCRMIGRSWFVTEESIRLHQANVLHDEIYRNRIENLKGAKKVAKPSAKVTAVSADSAGSAGSAAECSSGAATSEHSPELRAGASAPAPSVSPTVLPSVSPLIAPVAPVVAIKYETDERPLLPQLKKASVPAVEIPVTDVDPFEKKVRISKNVPAEIQLDTRVPSTSFTSAAVILPAAASAASSAASMRPRAYITSRPSYPELARSVILRRALNAAIALVLFVAVAVGGTYFLTSPGAGGAGGQVASAGASATVLETLDSIASFIGNGFDSALAIFGHGKEVATNQAPASNVLTNALVPAAPSGGQPSDAPLQGNSSEPPEQGIAIAPSSGSSVADEAMKQKIQANFSDQVEIHPDQSGTTGVITPVFRQAKGKDFIYVMVPVNGTRSP